jgi:ATP-dependent Zn protease
MMFEDEIIGYDYVKELFTRTFGMYENQTALEQMGARLPQSVLLYGEEHHGKSYMANLFVDEAERRGFKVIRIDMLDEIEKEDLDKITQSFKEESVCLFLDHYGLKEEEKVLPDWYVKIILDVQNFNRGFLIIGVSDNIDYDYEDESWPYGGLFEMKLLVDDVSFSDSKAILNSFIENKETEKLNIDDISAMLKICHTYKMIQRVLNNAYINAISCSKKLSHDFIIEAFNYYQYLYDNKDGEFRTEDDLIETAIHEAGHAVVDTVLGENVGFVSMLRRGHSKSGPDGVTYKFNEVNHNLNRITMFLAGMAAVDLKLHKFAAGTSEDLRIAKRIARNLILTEAYYGFEMMNLNMDIIPDNVTLTDIQRQAVIRLLEDKYNEAKEILLNNQKMLDYISEKLITRGYVFRSEIIRINKSEKKETEKNKTGRPQKNPKKDVVW